MTEPPKDTVDNETDRDGMGADREGTSSVRIPVDLLVALLFAGCTAGTVAASSIVPTKIRLLVAGPLVLFFFGYVLLAALFPEAASSSNEWVDSMLPAERIILSFALSIGATLVVALLVSYSSLPFSADTILLAVSGTTVITIILTAAVRARLPSERQYTVDFRLWVRRGHISGWQQTSSTEKVLNLVLILSLLFATTAVGYGIASQPQPEPFTEFTMMTESEDGSLVASGYPTDLTIGENRTLALMVGNQEGETKEYTVVAKLQRLTGTGGTTQIVESNELERMQLRVPAGESSVVRHTVTPSTTGERLQLIYLLYEEEPPTSPTENNAYRAVTLPISVSDPESDPTTANDSATTIDSETGNESATSDTPVSENEPTTTDDSTTTNGSGTDDESSTANISAPESEPATTNDSTTTNETNNESATANASTSMIVRMVEYQ